MSEKTGLDEATTDPAPREPVYTIAVGKWSSLSLTAYSFVLFFFAWVAVSTLTRGGAASGAGAVLGGPLVFLAVSLVTVVAHELVHGLFFRVFGGHPRYGAGWTYFMPYFYATSPGQEYTLPQMLVIGLAPLLVLSPLSLIVALAVPALLGYAGVAFMVNTAGAVGDMWMSSRLLRFRGLADVTVVDLRDGIAVYTEDPKAAQIADRLSGRDERRPTVVVFITQWIVATLAFVVAEFAVAFLAFLVTDNLTIGPPQFALVHIWSATTTQGTEAGFDVGYLPALLAGLLFALAMLLISRREE